MKLTNKTILITGGATGIGFALAKRLIDLRNQVIICGRNRDKLYNAKQALPDLITIDCDINSSQDINAMVSLLTARHSRLDMLINNAGIQQEIDLTCGKHADRDIEHEINTNLTAHINLTSRLYALISSNEKPAIIFIGSALGIVPKFNVPVYSAAKAGLHSFVQSLRYQAGKDQIQVCEIFPEVVETPMTRHRVNELKMDPDTFANQALKQLAQGKQNIFTGRTYLLQLLSRIHPGLAISAINKPQENPSKADYY